MKGINEIECFQLWDKLYRDGNFPGGFAKWLLDSDIVSYVPSLPPSVEWLEVVVVQVDQEVSRWQALIRQRRRAHDREIFEQDWKMGGKLHAAAVKNPPSCRFDSITQEMRICISPLKVAKGHPAAFRVLSGLHAVQPGAKWCFGKTCATVARVSADYVVLHEPMRVDMYKKSVSQKTWTAQPEAVYQNVKNFWAKFWDAEGEVNWEGVEKLVQGLPELEPFDPHISPEELQTAIDKLPVNEARGMDGWSNTELKSLGLEDVTLLACLFNLVTETGQWPEHLCKGLVALVSKVEDPQTAKDARPITVLSTLYRLYGKVMTQKIFRHWEGFLPPHLFGSVPGKSSMDAAWTLAANIESALAENRDLFGVSLDLSKAYNTLRREVLARFALRTGWPAKLVVAYNSFLSNLERYFQIHDGVYGPVTSCVGVPEGCPLAVPAMILTTWAVMNLVQSPKTTCVTYVDNWSLQCTDMPSVQLALQHVSWATTSLQLLLNPEKTRAYATTPDARSLLRGVSFQGFKLEVLNRVGDLGVDFGAARQHVAAPVLRKLEQNEPKLRRLQLMPWPAHRKAGALQKVIHPAISFGSELAAVSLSTFSTIRGKYSTAVWGKKNHRNHFLGPLFGCAVNYEPVLEILKRRVASFQRFFGNSPFSVIQTWNAVLQSQGKVAGPVTYLFQHLRILRWEPLQDGYCRTDEGLVVHLPFLGRRRGFSLFLGSWWRVVLPKLRLQEGLVDLQGTELGQTMFLRCAAKCNWAQVGCFTAGAAVFTDQKKHFLGDAEALCTHCGEVDSQLHRLRHCPFYSHLREGLPKGFLDSLPLPILTRGLWPTPQAVIELENRLNSTALPDLRECFDGHVCLFTDGSTYCNNHVSQSAWSVILAEPDSFENAIAAKGCLPGVQSNFRAELFAVFVAVRQAEAADIYSDNLGVVSGFKRLLRTGWVHSWWIKTAEPELWFEVAEALQSKNGPFRIHHVKSHQDPHLCTTEHEKWTFFHNDAADRAAKSAHVQDETTLSLLRRARQELQVQAHQAMLVFQLQQQMLCCAGSPQSKTRSVADTGVTALRVVPRSVPLLLGSPVSVQDLNRVDVSTALLGPRFCHVFRQYCLGQTWCKNDSGVSLLELYLHFASATGWVCPVNVAAWKPFQLPTGLVADVPACFVHETEYPQLKLCRPLLSKQLNLFRNVVRFMFKEAEIDFPMPRAKTLSQWGINEEVPSICIAPCTVRADVSKLSEIFWVHRRYSRAVAISFQPPRDPVECPLMFVSPRVTWARYYARRRLAVNS